MSVVEKSTGMFGRRLHRLEAIATELSGLYGDLARTSAAEREGKAEVYQRLTETTNLSHGERQARASHETVSLDSEVQSIKGRISSLVEERDLLKFFVEWDAGA